MERTCRWTVRDAKWYNGAPQGEFVDVPTAHTFASLLSSAPAGGGSGVPKQVLLVDLHEVDDLESTLNASGQWSNRRRPYDLVHGLGTYFASGLDHFLARVLLPTLTDVTQSFVIFPDAGAHRRFYTMVHQQLVGIPLENILFISKSRVGAQISQEERFSFVNETGEVVDRPQLLPAGSRIVIVDDFTNSGSTLFGGARIVRKRSSGKVHVSAYVSHYVAKYDRQAVTKFVDALFGENGATADLDQFYCTDSIPGVVDWLKEECAKRGGEPRLQVVPLAPLIAQWICSNPPQKKSVLQTALAGGYLAWGVVGAAAAAGIVFALSRNR